VTAAGGIKIKCFVISPIGADGSPERTQADTVLTYLIKKALSDGYEVLRADDDTNPGAITPRIIQSIIEADLIVADISGLNPNVFYELAVAHGYHKPTVHIQDAEGRPPFDIKDMRTISYDISHPGKLEQAQRQLAAFAKSALADPASIETPLRSAQQFEAVQASGDLVAQTNVQIMEAIDELRQEVKSLSDSAMLRQTIDRLLGELAESSKSRNPQSSKISSNARAIEEYNGAALAHNLEMRAKELIREINTPGIITVMPGARVAAETELQEVRDRLRSISPNSAYL
jgi:hypothetical protein